MRKLIHPAVFVIASLTLVACGGASLDDGADVRSSRENASGDDLKKALASIKKFTDAPTNIISQIPKTKDTNPTLADIIDAAARLNQILGIMATIIDLLPQDNATEDTLALFDAISAVSWQISREFLHDNVAKAEGAWNAARVALHTGMMLTAEGTPMVDSFAAVRFAADPLTSERVYRRADDGVVGAVGEPDHPNNLVYDWRLGVPVLMKLIGLRLLVIGAFDPNFANDDTFTDELLLHRSALLQHYNRMISEVRCGLAPPVGCGSAGCIATYGCIDRSTNLQNWNYDKYIRTMNRQDAEALSKLEIYRQMPLWQMRKMIDTLGLLARHGVPDLMIGNLISVLGNIDSCLDVKWGGTENGTPVQIYPCNGTDAQLWRYDRESGELRSAASDRCLDTAGVNLARGTPIQIWDCVGNDGQTWSYDPLTGVLQSKLGTVVDVKGGNPAPETPVWTWIRSEKSAQIWIANDISGSL